ncbi:MAG: DivIVA domain-containing protein [Clostridia bacterium]|nr:DivIVA domain-containing protein [Clostridia bacterium]
MLTPVDIENKEFAKAFRGYDSIEVDDFMQTLIKDYEKLYRENSSLKEKNAVISETLENYKGMESTMQNAILVAQRTSEDIRQNAHDRADTIIREAEAKAKDIISNAEKRSIDLEKDYTSLQKEMTTFKARMNSLLHTYLRLLEDMPASKATAKLPEEIAEAEPVKKEQPVTIPDYTTSIMNAEKKKDNRAVSGDSYVPKKINPLVDELLKKREEITDTDDDLSATLVVPKQEVKEEIFEEIKEVETAMAEESETNIPEEILIDLKNTFKEQYDVFNDETL